MSNSPFDPDLDPDGIPRSTISKLVDTWAAVADIVAPVSEERWKSPSELPGWTVQDVLSHLIGTERLLEGLPGAPHLDHEAPHVLNGTGSFNEDEVAARRPLAGADVLAEWNELRAQREATLVAGDAAYFAEPTDTPMGPGTRADFLAIRVIDCWSHEQDLRRVLGVPGNLDTPAAADTIDRLMSTLAIVVAKRSGIADGQAVRIVIEGPVERDVTCELTGKRAAFTDTPASPPVATVRFGTESFLVRATGRNNPTAAAAVTVEGDQEIGWRIADNLTMMV